MNAAAVSGISKVITKVEKDEEGYHLPDILELLVVNAHTLAFFSKLGLQ